MEHSMMMGTNAWIWIIFIGFTLVSWLVSNQLKSRFKKYSKIPTANGMTGKDVVESIPLSRRIHGCIWDGSLGRPVSGWSFLLSQPRTLSL